MGIVTKKQNIEYCFILYDAVVTWNDIVHYLLWITPSLNTGRCENIRYYLLLQSFSHIYRSKEDWWKMKSWQSSTFRLYSLYVNLDTYGILYICTLCTAGRRAVGACHCALGHHWYECHLHEGAWKLFPLHKILQTVALISAAEQRT